MKYSDLISFNPIEDVIQLTTADDANRAKEYVKSYVMSDTMAANLKSPVLDQLQMDEVVDNKGVLVVGNYGTGKSHLMSVISSIAKDADNLQYLQNKNFAKEMECIAGKFEVLRIEIGGVTMSLREILFGFIEDDFAARGIDFEVPDFDTVRDNKKLIRDMMMAFSAKYPDKGYLIVVDEFLSYLTSRDERQIVLDLEFFRALGEMCSKSKLRVKMCIRDRLDAVDDIKYKAMFATMYSSGMRVSEVIHLHYDDISRSNMQIHVRDTKNRMDRYTILSKRCLDLLTQYWFEKGRPRGILFPNKFTGNYLTVSALEQVMRRAVSDAELPSKATPHSLRHSFATHLMAVSYTHLDVYKRQI